MFTSSRSSLLLDYFRIPYRVSGAVGAPAGWVCLRPDRAAGGYGPALYWPTPAGRGAASYRLDDIPIFGHVAPEGQSLALRAQLGDRWWPIGEIQSERSRRAASIWREDGGSILLPFDPDEIMRMYWSEGYKELGRPSLAGRGKRRAVKSYYRVRPVLPRSAQISMRRAFSRVQARTAFPRWPAEGALHDLYDRLLALLASVAGEPVPTIAPWPAGRSWALVLTHDVETETGYESIRILRDAEVEAGCRSSWNLVPKRYEVADATVSDLRARGFEVGVHGLYHDGRDLESRELLEERLPEIRQWADRWGAGGFRSPATHRRWEWMPLLGFDHDSSYPDTDPFEPQSGGCCSWLPFMNGDLVELPITLPQDHTLFVILRRDESAWLEKAEVIRGRGGMALLITHPDYMIEPERVEAYRRFLAETTRAPGVWCALPSEVSSWWRRRAASRIKREGDRWRVAGPAAGEAVVALAGAPATASAANAGRPEG